MSETTEKTVRCLFVCPPGSTEEDAFDYTLSFCKDTYNPHANVRYDRKGIKWSYQQSLQALSYTEQKDEFGYEQMQPTYNPIATFLEMFTPEEVFNLMAERYRLNGNDEVVTIENLNAKINTVYLHGKDEGMFFLHEDGQSTTFAQREYIKGINPAYLPDFCFTPNAVAKPTTMFKMQHDLRMPFEEVLKDYDKLTQSTYGTDLLFHYCKWLHDLYIVEQPERSMLLHCSAIVPC